MLHSLCYVITLNTKFNWGSISYSKAQENRSIYKLDFKHPIHKPFGTFYALSFYQITSRKF